MLLSSMAESMYWCGRYVERAQALSRVVSSYQRLGMDLPGARALDVKPLMALGGYEGGRTPTKRAGLLDALVFDHANASSVLGALNAARENLRNARVSVPPELWHILNRLYGRVSDARGRSEPVLLDALGETLAAGQRFDGERGSGMLRDAAHAFLTIGCLLERADMQLRTLAVLVPVLHPDGWERTFDDVRWVGLLNALGITSMYRSVHHLNAELSRLLSLVLIDVDCPRSLAFCLRGIERHLRALPRAGRVRTALARVERDGVVLSRASREHVTPDLERALNTLADLHAAVQACYFPADEAPAAAVPRSAQRSPAVTDPFAYLGREHEATGSALQVLEELAARVAGGEAIDRHDLGSIVGFLSDFGELSHHEKEESILTPELVAGGFDWYDGPLAVMRREHRQEHHLVRLLSQLASQSGSWSSDAARSFVDVARELCHFLRGHMDHERRDLFEQAARVLSEEAKQRLLAAFRTFDARQPPQLASTALDELVHKYRPTAALAAVPRGAHALSAEG